MERAIRSIRGSFFAARPWRDIDDLNAQALAWCHRIAADRPWPEDRSITVREAFERERGSLHLVPAGRKGCAVVSTGGATASLPEWIEAWNPGRIFRAYDATRQGDDAAAWLIRNDSRVVRLRPALDGLDWNDMLMRDRAGEPLQIDDRPLD